MEHLTLDNTGGFTQKTLDRLNEKIDKEIKKKNLDSDDPNYDDIVQEITERILNNY